VLITAVVFSFSPFAFAVYTLDKPSAGQVIFIDANNELDYRASFPISALTGAFKEGDDLRLEFPAALLTLNDFFVPLGEWRGLVFSDERSLGGTDFDESGNYTGVLHDLLTLEKKDDASKLHADAEALGHIPFYVEISPYGKKVFANGEEVYGELSRACLDTLNSFFPIDRPDWSIYEKIRFELTMAADGSLSPVRAYLDFTNGIRSVTLNPHRTYPSSNMSFVPVSSGRALLSFSNSRGEELSKVYVRCYETEEGQLAAVSDCLECGQDLFGKLHYLPCGHYSCSPGFDESSHSVPQCQIAGHCSSENEHEKCRNCLEYTCIGGMHGIGYCKHEHNWVDLSAKSSQCVSCGYVYTR